MEEIMKVPMGLEQKAQRVSEFRSRIKSYLTEHEECYDKFTITESDTFLGYVSETAIAEYLTRMHGNRIEIYKWADKFDIDRIVYSVNNNVNDIGEIAYVKEYFYDKYDLEIVEKTSGKVIYADVKTAETCKKPQGSWDFLYPVVQNKRSGKDCVILCYYYKQIQEKKIILVGYISEQEIAEKHILKAGSRTRFGTINRIDNYETKISDYQSLEQMLNYYYGYHRG